MNPFEKALWLAPSEPSPSPIISHRFELAALPKKAELYVTGLGFFDASVNGVSVLGDEYFQPVVSDYEKRDFKKITYPCSDIFTHRIYYRIFDVSELLEVGKNLIEIQTGGGWYVQNERVAEGEMSYSDRTKCIFSLKYDGGEISSDGSEEWRDSEIVYSNLFVGECHDPTACPRSGRVKVLAPPDSELCEQIGVPDRRVRTIEPKMLGKVGTKTVFDAGENVSGLVKLRTRNGYKGTLTLRFAEKIKPDLTLDFLSSGSDYSCVSGGLQIMTDRFVCDGTVRDFMPKFVWHAFRYFEVEGEFERVSVEVIHADTPVTAKFNSDSQALNFLFDAYIRTQLDNMHGSFPSDCPHRERLGYTGDGQICAPSAMLMLDAKEFYRKWIVDILDCQDKLSGHVQHTAPFQGGGGGPGGWGCAIVLVPYYFLKQYGKEELAFVSSCYEPMKRWISYLESHSQGYLVTSEVAGGWCLGDWCTLEKCRIPEPFVNSYYLAKSLEYMCDIARLLGRDGDIEAFSALREKVTGAIKSRYFDEKEGVFADGAQGVLAYAADLGLCQASRAAEYYDALGHFDSGFLGTDILCDVLFENGFAQSAYDLLSGEQVGSYLNMKRHGATTLWERWTGGGSHNHPMFGAPARQIFSGILGIRQCRDSFGWEKVEIKPVLPNGMNFATGSIMTPKGRIEVTLVRKGDEIKADISLPSEIKRV